ncbi:MAG: M48 family metallopeptidase [Ruminococcus sp.]|nr:M48 family metallopeptidase [Ruminococcus sp.]MCM1480573.1 M48 family metallopeptidase [Muribaculaceae bacterium]
MSELRKLTVDGKEIIWQLSRKKVKNVNMRVKPDGTVSISAPNRVPIGFIEDFIRQKSDFIFSALERFSSLPPEPELPKIGETFQNGDTLRYFGTDYTLSIIISPIEEVKLSGTLMLTAARTEERTGLVLKKFYERETAKLFFTLNRRTCLMFREKGYSVPFADLQIRGMSSRWGSCHVNQGKIVMNSRLALYPEACTEYVFIHEYAHFVVPNHSKAFYALVGELMPDYKTCVNILKNHR